jgi:hypothetical protein
MTKQLVDRLSHRCGLGVELWRAEDTPEGCLLYKRLLWGEVTAQQLILENQANGLVTRLVQEGFTREEES